MTDARTDLDDGDRLPWLEAVEDENAAEGPSALKLIAAVVIGLVAIGLVVGGLFWLGSRGGDAGANGDGELIEAPEGAYRVAPETPGGMQVEGQGGSAHAASAGAEKQGNLSMRVPEAPVSGQPKAPAGQAPAAQPAAPSGPAIQLGAFSSQAAAQNAWRAMSGRFRYLAPLTHSIQPVQAGGRTLYRLRASGPGSADVCRRLQVAGETCAAVR
jgi:hypothetical protein